MWLWTSCVHCYIGMWFCTSCVHCYDGMWLCTSVHLLLFGPPVSTTKIIKKTLVEVKRVVATYQDTSGTTAIKNPYDCKGLHFDKFFFLWIKTANLGIPGSWSPAITFLSDMYGCCSLMFIKQYFTQRRPWPGHIKENSEA